MQELRIESIDEPLASDGLASVVAAHFVSRSQYVGALPSLEGAQRLGRELLSQALDGLATQGVARDAAMALRAAVTSREYQRILEAAGEQLADSPMPKGTWPVIVDVLGEELLSQLLGVSTASIRRYARGERSTPETVAERLHFVALLVADLSGAYNEYGIRRWFLRARPQLAGASPLVLLVGGFDPAGQAAASVRELVDSLVATGAA